MDLPPNAMDANPSGKDRVGSIAKMHDHEIMLQYTLRGGIS